MINNSLKAEAVTPLNSDLIKSDEIITLNKKTLTSLDEKMKKAVSTAEEYNEKSKEILGDELDSIVYEANRKGVQKCACTAIYSSAPYRVISG